MNIEKTAPFYPIKSNALQKTGLVIYPNNHNEKLPVSGILKNRFDEISKLYEQISDNKTSLKINGSKKFIKLIKNSIKTLLTRKTGRVLVENLIKTDKPFTIQEECEYKNGSRFNPKTGEFYLYTGKTFVYTETAEESIPYQKQPLFIVLGHEFIHALTGKHDEKLEEKIVITGIGEQVYEDEFHEKTYYDHEAGKIYKYYPLNENALRKAFSLPKRINHFGFQLPKKPDFELKNGYLTKEASSYLKNLILLGNEKNITKAINSGFNINSKLNTKETLFEFQIKEVSSWNKKIAEFLIEKGAEINPKDEKGNTLLARISKPNLFCSHIIDFLRENGAEFGPNELSFDEDHGVTLLMKAMNIADKNAIETLLKLDEDPLFQNEQGLTAITYCIKSERSISKIMSILELFVHYLPQNDLERLRESLTGYGNQTFQEWLQENKNLISMELTPRLHQLISL